MSDNSNPKGHPASTHDNTSEDLDWLELEGENFDDSDFDEQYHDSEVSEQTQPQQELKAKNLTERSERKSKKGFSFKFILLTVSILGGSALYINFFNSANTGQSTPSEDVPVVSLDSRAPTEQSLSDIPPTDINTQALGSDTPTIPTTPASMPDANLSKTSTQQEQTVLTPLPDPLASQAVELPPLDEEQQLASNEQTARASELQPPLSVELNTATAVPPAAVVYEMTESTPEQKAVELVPPDTAPSTPEPAVLSETALIAQTDKKPESAKTAELPLATSSNTPTAPENPMISIMQPENPSVAVAKVVAEIPMEGVPSLDLPPALPLPTEQKVVPIITQAQPAAEKAVAQNAPEKTVPANPADGLIKTGIPAPKTDTANTEKPLPKAKTATTVSSSKKLDSAQKITTPAAKKPTKDLEKSKKITPTSWQLRSAQPGMAVIFDPATGNMQSIEVGDRVQGIGRIQSITIVNGKWVVRGSTGKISQ